MNPLSRHGNIILKLRFS